MESSNTSWDWPNGCTSTNSFNKIQGVRRKRGLEWIRLVRCSKDSMQIIVAGCMWLYIYRYTVYICYYICTLRQSNTALEFPFISKYEYRFVSRLGMPYVWAKKITIPVSLSPHLHMDFDP